MRAEEPAKNNAKTDDKDEPGRTEIAAPGRQRHLVRFIAFIGWGILLGLVYSFAIGDPSFANLVTAAGLTVVFGLVNLQVALARWLGHRSLRRLSNKLHGSAYLSELQNLPNRNYLLAELRREMPRSRSIQTPFVLIMLSIDDIDDIRERRGADFADRSVVVLAELLKRLTRSSDFLAHLGGAKFCVMLVECSREQAWTYLRRVPGVAPVSDGLRMLDVTISARLNEYDLESLYATDVLRDVETAKALRRREEPRMDSIAA
jgi:diguanylate cyclase (GGDEF)-like protein